MRGLLTITFCVSMLCQAISCAADSGACLQNGDAQTASQAESTCWQQAATQLAMNQCAEADLREADSELNRTYEEVLARFAREPNKLAAIKKAQRAWIVFRDAEIDALFPASHTSEQGSATVMCRPIHLARMTSQRTKELQELVNRREGDVCSQSPQGLR